MNTEETIEFEKTGKRPDPKKGKSIGKLLDKLSSKINKGIENINPIQQKLMKLYKKISDLGQSIKKKSKDLSKKQLGNLNEGLEKLKEKTLDLEIQEMQLIVEQADLHTEVYLTKRPDVKFMTGNLKEYRIQELKKFSSAFLTARKAFELGASELNYKGHKM